MSACDSSLTIGPRAGRGDGMERGHRPVGEQAIELMKIPRRRARSRCGLRFRLGNALDGRTGDSGRVVGIDISDEMITLAHNIS